ncbi:tetratricopeptide repeat protein [Paracoccus sp. JM45]|uniref:tetratricopeptide repeat protein n=1 Tax=Paracoccus sp. JM45 TaxID=2283626 RepID=UPI000E6C8955|nr:tetratricopeptide repeat protein [Paracoccus sp. JM45]RJE80429.1 tetratricopeptide repeat protein [Paracoccus sp. JM45]
MTLINFRPVPSRLALIAALFSIAGGFAAPVWAQADQRPAARPDHNAPLTHGLAGPYLAARLATVDNDFSAAAKYFAQASAHDPEDVYLQDSALVALTSAGDVEGAVKLADEMIEQNGFTELAGLMHRARLIHDGQWQALVDFIDENRQTDVPLQDDLMDGIIRAWAILGAGRASDAVQAFQDMAANPATTPIVNYHLAMARALAGDYETANDLMQNSEANGHLLGIQARVQILAQLDRRDEAIALLDGLQGASDEPQLQALYQKLQNGDPIAFDVISGPQGGIGHLLLSFASALSDGADPEPLSLIHARLAAWIAPDNPEAHLMVAQFLQERQQFDLAEAEFETVRKMGQMRPQAELSRIDALARADRADDAEKAALSLTAAYPDMAPAWIALADVKRQQEDYKSAITSYDKALQLLEDAPAPARWFPLYARGIALERDGQFDRAEADLQAALEIRPDQASLLNYLGYSWIDRGENLDRALGMIEKAVKLSPDDGYILDSLAWAYYRLGRYEEAVAPMEAAIGTMASDPVVNDHLGDIYWKVGRKREAQIQWRRALSFDPAASGEVKPERIRDKLDRGLDAVLKDEGASADTNPTPQPKSEADATE